MGWREQEPGPQETGGAAEISASQESGRGQMLLETLKGSPEGQAATAPPGGRAGGKDAPWRAEGLLSHGENFHRGRRERPASRVNRGIGFISVVLRLVCGQSFTGRWSGVNFKPVSLESVYDAHAWSQEILAADLLSSDGPDEAVSCT